MKSLSLKNYPYKAESYQTIVHHAEIYEYDDDIDYCELIDLSIQWIDEDDGKRIINLQWFKELEFKEKEMKISTIVKELKAKGWFVKMEKDKETSVYKYSL